MYLFTSARLGFRNWNASDLAPLQALNQDPAVMEFFPALKTLEESKAFISRMQQEFSQRGYCFFAVDILETQTFIGFIGFTQHTYLEELGSIVEIGWRLQQSSWNKGYATEGAKACLKYGFEQLDLTTIYAITPFVNKKSQRVMDKIGMHYLQKFEEKLLKSTPHLNPCVLYQISKNGNT